MQTGSDAGAGTDSRVFVQICGELGETAAQQLAPEAQEGRSARRAPQRGPARAPGAPPQRLHQRPAPAAAALEEEAVPFQRGSLDAFVLRSLADVGGMSHVVIGHDGSGACSGATRAGCMNSQRGHELAVLVLLCPLGMCVSALVIW